MLIDIGTLEFICSQSPYSMKGLLLGTFFSMKYSFQVLAITSIFPFGRVEVLSCGSGFYIMTVIIGIVELVLFGCAAKRYKYRTIDEPCNEYRYAEEYYSAFQSGETRVSCPNHSTVLPSFPAAPARDDATTKKATIHHSLIKAEPKHTPSLKSPHHHTTLIPTETTHTHTIPHHGERQH